MSARKLGRFAGLVFVLAAFLGGVGAASAEHAAGGESAAAKVVSLSIDWD
jgi:hypothetical protein